MVPVSRSVRVRIRTVGLASAQSETTSAVSTTNTLRWSDQWSISDSARSKCSHQNCFRSRRWYPVAAATIAMARSSFVQGRVSGRLARYSWSRSSSGVGSASTTSGRRGASPPSSCVPVAPAPKAAVWVPGGVRGGGVGGSGTGCPQVPAASRGGGGWRGSRTRCSPRSRRGSGQLRRGRRRPWPRSRRRRPPRRLPRPSPRRSGGYRPCTAARVS